MNSYSYERARSQILREIECGDQCAHMHTHTHTLKLIYLFTKCQRPQETHHAYIYSFTLYSKRKKNHYKRSLSWRSGGGGDSGGGVGGDSHGSPHTIILYFQSVNDFRFLQWTRLTISAIHMRNTFHASCKES